MKNEDIVTIYVTKYWSTGGIYEFTGKVYVASNDTHYCKSIRGGHDFFRIGLGAGGFLTREEAVAYVKKAAAKKAKALRKKADELEKYAEGLG